MNKILLNASGLLVLALLLFVIHQSINRPAFAKATADKPAGKQSPEPSDYLWAQRAFPYSSVPSDAFYKALEQVQNTPQDRGDQLNWELAGPTHVSGRITDVAMHHTDLQTIYAASASGGVWKSADAGESWFPITDGLPSLSIGDIAIDLTDKNTLYVGTGEPNGGGGSITYDGRGVFKSSDGGISWISLGLESSGSIGRIEVDPENPNRIFVAAMGHLFDTNAERGIFRSEDGGASWEKSLFVNDSTGGIDLAIHPFNPDTVFAVTWQRTRRPNKRVYGGPGCAIWRSVDGGDNWTKLSAGLPASNLGRIGIAVSPSQPSTLYALYADQIGLFKGVYKSTNNGDSWSLLSGGDPGYPGFGWWFGQIRVHPNDPNAVYTLGLNWAKTTNGGQSWTGVSDYLHADYHALYIHPENPDLQVVGNDGGIFISTNAGENWEHRPFPITQFYTSEINFQYPTLFSGGAQDNGTWRSRFGGLDDWEFFYGGDGFVTLVHPYDTSIYYAAYQYGGFAGSNGATAPDSSRYNWNTPYIFDPIDPNVMYIGAEKLFKSTNGGIDWTAISNDLSNGPTGQNGVQYGTITTIAASPLNADVLWVGTDDGNVWVTSNSGLKWKKVSASLPKRWITRVVADPGDENYALVCLSGYRHADDIAHIYQTTNKGQSWQNVSGNLPDLPVNDLVVDPADPLNTWYIATDAGMFCTINGGDSWQPCNAGLPTVPVTDLTLHAPSRTIAAATFGRAMYRAVLPVLSSTQSPQTIDNVRISPNPMVHKVQVSFTVFKTQRIRLDLFDLSGKRVKTLFSGQLAVGEQAFDFEGIGLNSGIYLLKMETDNGFTFCKKVIKI
ncbi:MAG: T9SS type A sorting domain-containing protein [Saprospiraceae bacterium]|nr:T9SS type A sorting domain-containing protein [Saprospiraceae bacterium]